MDKIEWDYSDRWTPRDTMGFIAYVAVLIGLVAVGLWHS